MAGLFAWSGGTQGLTTNPGGALVANSGMVLSGASARYFRGRMLTLNGPSTWTDGALYLANGSTLNVNSTLDIQSDTAMTYNSGAVSTFNNNGDLTKTSGTGLTTLGFNFYNTGSINISNGALKFDKQFIQTNTGSLAVRINSSSFDSYEILGAATLDGVLEINLLNGFIPSEGESFDIMTFSSSTGVFSSITGADIGNGTHFEATYGAKSVSLTVISD